MVKDFLKSRSSRIIRDLESNEDVLFRKFTRMSKTERLYAFGDCGANDVIVRGIVLVLTDYPPWLKII
jgi:hypothetical protein